MNVFICSEVINKKTLKRYLDEKGSSSDFPSFIFLGQKMHKFCNSLGCDLYLLFHVMCQAAKYCLIVMTFSFCDLQSNIY